MALNDLKKAAFQAALVTTSENIDDLELEWLTDAGATAPTFLSADGTEHLVPNTLLAADGTVHSVPQTFLGADGASYNLGNSNVNDAWLRLFAAQLTPDESGNFNDDAYAYLGDLGHTGAISARWVSFYTAALP